MNIFDEAIKSIAVNKLEPCRAFQCFTTYLYDSVNVGEVLEDDSIDLEIMNPLPEFAPDSHQGNKLDDPAMVIDTLFAWSKALDANPSVEGHYITDDIFEVPNA